MTGYVVARLGILVVLVFVVSVLTFSLLLFTEGDPAEIILRQRMQGEPPSEAAIAALRMEMGLDRPLPVQYARWLRRALRGDLGYSYRTGKDVTDEIMDRFPRTALLAVLSVLICAVLAVPMGVLAARRRGGAADHLVLGSTILMASVPLFWLGIVFVLVFSLLLGLFPVAGDDGPLHYVLPAATLAAAISATTARLTRSSVIEVLDEDYIRTARAKGLSEFLVVAKHALRNALAPVITILGLNLRFLLGGAVFVEIVFCFHGIGLLLYEAVMSRDYPVVQGCVLLLSLTTVLVNLLIDLSYPLVNPTIRLAGGKR